MVSLQVWWLWLAATVLVRRAEGQETQANDAAPDELPMAVRSLGRDKENRIVGGHEVDTPDRYPFMVHGNGCGGSLVAKDVVFTAAHCRVVFEYQPYVHVGAFRDDSIAGGAEKRMIMGKMYQHPFYTEGKQGWDYLLFKIVPSTKTPIAINLNNTVPENDQRLRIIGFGDTYFKENMGSEELRETDVYYVAPDECEAAYNGGIVSQVELCAGVDGGGHDSCQGDSGGPVFIPADDEYTEPLLVGAVSWAKGCAKPNFPGVNSRISGAVNWIVPKICELSDFDPPFCDDFVPGPPTTAPTRLPQPLYFYIDIRYDQNPAELGLVIKDALTGKRVFNHPAGKAPGYQRFGTFYWQLRKLEAGRKYLIKMIDKGNDGLTKGGIGYVWVYAFWGDQFGPDSELAGTLVYMQGRFKKFKTRFRISSDFKGQVVGAERTSDEKRKGGVLD